MEKRPKDTAKDNKAIVIEGVVLNPIEPTELELGNLGHSEQVLLKILTDLLEIREAI